MTSFSREEIGQLYQILDQVGVRGEVAKREVVDLMDKLVAIDKEILANEAKEEAKKKK